MAYSHYAVPEFPSAQGSASTYADDTLNGFSQYAGVAMVLAMIYMLVIEKNIALFAVLFLTLSIFYNPTKFSMNGKVYQDSEVIL